MRAQPPGPFALQAAIAAVHARAARREDTDWDAMVKLYDTFVRDQPSPVVALNRAVAVAMAEGPRAGPRDHRRARGSGELDDYHLLHAARADLLRRIGDAAAGGGKLSTRARSRRKRKRASFSRAAARRGGERRSRARLASRIDRRGLRVEHLHRCDAPNVARVVADRSVELNRPMAATLSTAVRDHWSGSFHARATRRWHST